MKKQLNKNAKLAFFTARKRAGDKTRLSEITGLSESHIANVLNGNRSVNEELANAMYSISSRRNKATA